MSVGGSVIDPKLVQCLVQARARVERSPLQDLTLRERDVLALIAQGACDGAIATPLVLSKGAVEQHVNAIFLKLGLADAQDISKRVKAALIYLSDSDAGVWIRRSARTPTGRRSPAAP